LGEIQKHDHLPILCRWLGKEDASMADIWFVNSTLKCSLRFVFEYFDCGRDSGFFTLHPAVEHTQVWPQPGVVKESVKPPSYARRLEGNARLASLRTEQGAKLSERSGGMEGGSQ
jgi:hypothetical protein